MSTIPQNIVCWHELIYNFIICLFFKQSMPVFHALFFLFFCLFSMVYLVRHFDYKKYACFLGSITNCSILLCHLKQSLAKVINNDMASTWLALYNRRFKKNGGGRQMRYTANEKDFFEAARVTAAVGFYGAIDYYKIRQLNAISTAAWERGNNSGNSEYYEKMEKKSDKAWEKAQEIARANGWKISAPGLYWEIIALKTINNLTNVSLR